MSDMPLYCPNCCFYLAGRDVPVCPKCSADIAQAQADKERKAGRLTDALTEWVEENPELAADGPPGEGPRQLDAAPKPASPVCPECAKPMSPFTDEGLSVDLLGHEVSVQDVNAMHMTIRKRAVTNVTLEFTGWICPDGHRFYEELRETVRELCPVCRGHLARFGNTLLTCKSCDINLTRSSFLRMDGRRLLADEGWLEYPRS